MSIGTTQPAPLQALTRTPMWKQTPSILPLSAALPLALIGLTVALAGVALGPFGFHSHPRASANRNAAVATLKCIAEAQGQALEIIARDSDMDGIGEYATIAELAGATEIRTACGLGVGPLDTPLLPPSLGDLTPAGCSPRQGYLFRVFLAGDGVGDRIPGLPNSPTGGFTPGGPLPNADNGEQHWCAYAWPIDADSLSTRVFFLDERGVLLETENSDLSYAGEAAAPDFDAALSIESPGDMQSPLAINGALSNDGQDWRVVAP